MTAQQPLLGFGLPVSGAWATPAGLRRVARRAEELGHASLWTFQRTPAPVGADLNLSPRVAAPDAAHAYADEVLEAFAPR